MTFNLIHHAWIPVRLRDGSRSLIRPGELVLGLEDNSALRPDWPRPDLNIATLELLIGLLQTAFPPRSSEEWREKYHAPPSVDELDKALAPFASHFNLDGPGSRFMQDFEMLEGDASKLEGLFIDSAGENTIKKNADLMVKRLRYSHLSRAAATIGLYALQQFAPAGGAGHRTSMRGGGPLTTLILPPGIESRPASLWHLLWSNVKETVESLEGVKLSRIFPWTAETLTSSNKLEVHQSDPRVHPLQAFFGMPRRIRLVFEKNTQAKPCDLTGVIDDIIVTGYVTRPYGVNYGLWQHPLSPYYQMKEGEQPLPKHPPAGNFSYRNWLTLIAGDATGLSKPAKVVTHYRQNRHSIAFAYSEEDSRVLAAGWAMSNMKPLDYILAEQPLHDVTDFRRREELDLFAQRLIAAADSAARSTYGAVQDALKSSKDKPKIDTSRITTVRDAFFAQTENSFHALLNEAANTSQSGWQDKLAERWLRQLQQTGFALFDTTIQPDPGNPERSRKIVQARKKLSFDLIYSKTGKSLSKLLSLPEINKKGEAA